ncbi:MAG TPA: DegT/DnrJ/EryC1/StrS family aminotransferase [Aquaticitalea sp.]|nr:DegT/DnrJ/EryC1/StrS family aminotransferase [Aquaticitalea sp.]
MQEVSHNHEHINVTKVFLPNQQEYHKILQVSWDKSWITNRGDLVLELEQKMKQKFRLEHVLLTTNGTLPLQIALKALRLTGEVITTPFSYVATTSSIVWEGLTPVFADIEADSFTIDPLKIEEKITPRTSAILATHVFGNPCDVLAIERLAKKYNLRIIYDAAHSFGVEYHDTSIFEYGDISTCSFHATKIFHTGEGGAFFTKSNKLYETLYHHHNFGHHGPEKFHGLGINAKMSELQAAMGLAVWPYLDAIFSRRKFLYERYLNGLSPDLGFQEIRPGTVYNYSYFPVVFKSEAQLLRTQAVLNQNHIVPRRYFYPSLNTLPYVAPIDVPIAESLSERILCLPLYFDLTDAQVDLICNLINNSLDGFET